MYSIFVSLFIPFALFCVTLILWNCYNFRLRDVTVQAPLPPGSFGLPIVGQTLSFLLFKTKFFDRRRQKLGSIYKTHLFGNPTVRITDNSDIISLLKEGSQNVSNSWPRSAHALLKGGLALETSPVLHKRKRKLILKAFGHEQLSRYVDIMADTCRQYVTQWRMAPNVVHLYPELRTMAFHVVCRCLLGMTPCKEDMGTFMNLFREFVNGMFCLPIDLPGFTFHKALKARKRLLAKLDSYMKERNAADDTDHSLNALSFLGELSTVDGVITDEAKSIALELLFAGHESTASAATTMVINICKHPSAYNDVWSELSDVRFPLTYDVTNRLNHVDAVVRESLRLNPPIGAGYRRVTKTFLCQGYQVPASWTVIYGIRESHENSTVTSSPREFMPERWFSEERAKLSSDFLTFGAGGRKCIGKHFAELFLKVFLAVLVRDSKVRLVKQEVELDGFPVPHPKDELPVIFDEL